MGDGACVCPMRQLAVSIHVTMKGLTLSARAPPALSELERGQGPPPWCVWSGAHAVPRSDITHCTGSHKQKLLSYRRNRDGSSLASCRTQPLCKRGSMCAFNGGMVPFKFNKPSLASRLCGTAVLGFGVYLMTSLEFSSLIPSVPSFSIASCLVIIGTIISCIAFLGFLGALKENRCLLISFFILLFILMMMELAAACVLLAYEKEVGTFIKEDLQKSLKTSEASRKSGNETKKDDWDVLQQTGCFELLKDFFEEHFLTTGAAVITICIIEVLGMCFAMTLFCHISRSGLGYK
ncbi:Leukocyte surface antigen CD53-like [Scleropages formosus]|uniref:Leukocyte surface antigen CD53-like n=1 Tax=Scleropages formosus TaxID=113540 RepID=A0A0P7TUN0_SCLFO|nr:Leukocyte surface antigen CD53-like [Scleropages formosus]